MINLINTSLKQIAVYWGTPSSDGRGGRQFAAPVQINVRWDDKQEKFIDLAGNEVVSRAVVQVGQDVQVGGYLYLGTLASLTQSTDPMDVKAAKEIRGFLKAPSFRGDQNQRTAYL